MAIYMLKLFDHPELATAMRKAKRKHIEANYNLDKHTEKLFQVLQSLLSNN